MLHIKYIEIYNKYAVKNIFSGKFSFSIISNLFVKILFEDFNKQILKYFLKYWKL